MDTCLQVFHFVGLCKGLDRPQTVDNVLGFTKVNLIQCISDLVLHVLHQATCTTDWIRILKIYQFSPMLAIWGLDSLTEASCSTWKQAWWTMIKQASKLWRCNSLACLDSFALHLLSIDTSSSTSYFAEHVREIFRDIIHTWRVSEPPRFMVPLLALLVCNQSMLVLVSL